MSNVRVQNIRVVPKPPRIRNSPEIKTFNEEINRSEVVKSAVASEKPPAYSTPPSVSEEFDSLPTKSIRSSKRSQTNNKTSTIRLLLIIVGFFISVILLALVAIGIFGLVILTSTTTKSVTTVTTTTTTTTMTVTYSSECSNYTTINDITRLAIHLFGTACDNSTPFDSSLNWFRFDGIGGTMIANYTVPPFRCSTTYSGWYSGSMPTDGNSATGLVCFTTTTTNCLSPYPIAVTNCSSFYVYGLTAVPICNARFCTI